MCIMAAMSGRHGERLSMRAGKGLKFRNMVADSMTIVKLSVQADG